MKFKQSCFVEIFNPNEASLDAFLEECKFQTDRMEAIISRGRLNPNYRPELTSIVYAPFSVRFECSYGILTNRIFTHIPYGKDNPESPVGGIIGGENPSIEVIEYGKACADKCAQAGFNAFLYLLLTNDIQRSLIYSVKPCEVKKNKIKIPSRLIL